MSPDQLKEILDAHAKWACGKAGKRADLRRADLRGADLWGANLERANLEGANLERANLRGADLERADLRGADLERANLRGADLRRADLRGADLERANLRGADLRRADLRGAKYGDATIADLVAHVTRVNDPYEFFAWRTDKGDFIKAGCRFLTVAEYREHAKSYEDQAAKYAETVAVLDFIEARFKAVTP